MKMISYATIVISANKIAKRAKTFTIVSFLIVLIHKIGVKILIAIKIYNVFYLQTSPKVSLQTTWSIYEPVKIRYAIPSPI